MGWERHAPPPLPRSPKQQSRVQAPDSPPCPFLFRREKLSLGKSQPISPESSDDIYTQTRLLTPHSFRILHFPRDEWKLSGSPGNCNWAHGQWGWGDNKARAVGTNGSRACNCLTQILCFFTNQKQEVWLQGGRLWSRTNKRKDPSAPDPLPYIHSTPRVTSRSRAGGSASTTMCSALNPGIPPSENVSLYFYLTKNNHRFSNAGNNLRHLRTVWPKYLHLSITSWNKVIKIGTAHKAGGTFIW